MRVYKLMHMNKYVGNYIYDDRSGDIKAIRFKEVTNFPINLFGLSGDEVVDKRRVLNYINSIVPPKDNDNIKEILGELNIGVYNSWEIYVAMSGYNTKDSSFIDANYTDIEEAYLAEFIKLEECKHEEELLRYN